ncbi:unnamed protein product [Rotaria magnacalcarata]
MGQSSSMSSDSSTSSMQDLDTNMSSSSTSSSYIPYTAGRTTAAIVPSSTFPGVDVQISTWDNHRVCLPIHQHQACKI